MRNIKRRPRHLLFLLFLAIPFICLWFPFSPEEYVYQLKYINAFGKIRHPTNTRLISRHSHIGRLHPLETIFFDDRNFFVQLFDPLICSHLTGEVREYSGTLKDIRTFYAPQTITIGGHETAINIYSFDVDALGRPASSEVALGVDYFLTMDYYGRSPLDNSWSYYFVYFYEHQNCP